MSSPTTRAEKKLPPWKKWDKLAQKNGNLATCFAMNGDKYKGDWKHNQKHGTSIHISSSVQEMVCIFGKMEVNMKENGEKTKETERECIQFAKIMVK